MLLFPFVACSKKHFTEATGLCQKQSSYDAISYQAQFRSATSFDTDTVTTITNNYLVKSVDDTLYPYEFLNIDDAGNFVSYSGDTVFSYNSAFEGQYYDLTKIYGHDMIEGGYKYNTLLPEACNELESLASGKWKRSKQEKNTTYLGTTDNLTLQLEFDESDRIVFREYSYWSDSYHYFGQHLFSNYKVEFNRDTVLSKSGKLLNYEAYRQQIKADEIETEKNRIRFPVFETLQGEQVDITAKEDIYVLDFFFNGCPPCVASVPKLNELFEIIGDKVPMYGINAIDKSAERIRDFQTKYGVRYPLLMADKSFNSSIRINSYPELLVIKNGEVIYRHIGTLHSTEDISEFLKENL